jgi:hypothetical protein
MLLVEIIDHGAPKDGIKKGNVFKAIRYKLDPSEKFTLIEKVSGSKAKYKPSSRNHYARDLKIIGQTM